jgi:hypothetical protein
MGAKTIPVIGFTYEADSGKSHISNSFISKSSKYSDAMDELIEDIKKIFDSGFEFTIKKTIIYIMEI